MTNTPQEVMAEKSVLRWGGLAGILGSIIFILVFAVVIVFVLPEPNSTEEVIRRFPDVRTVRTVENTFYLVALLLYVINLLALYRALRGMSPASALFGTAMGILGLSILAVGALLHFFQARISDLYHAPGTTSAEQESLVLIWEVSQTIFETFLFTGLIIVPIGYISLGVGMVGTPAFGKRLGWMSVGLGVIGIVAASFVLVGGPSELSAVGVFALIIFHLVLGWKVHRLSRGTQGV